MIIFLALTLTIAGCVCLYLASPNQKWLAQALPGRPILVAGGLLLLAGLATFIAAWRPLCGVFMTLHVTMVCLLVFPYVAALRGIGRET
jgi:hypothetical protein